jgi:hypothetical protein
MKAGNAKKLNRLDQQERIPVLVIEIKKIKDRKKAHDL